MIRHFKNDAGLTILEIIVAMGILLASAIGGGQLLVNRVNAEMTAKTLIDTAQTSNILGAEMIRKLAASLEQECSAIAVDEAVKDIQIIGWNVKHFSEDYDGILFNSQDLAPIRDRCKSAPKFDLQRGHFCLIADRQDDPNRWVLTEIKFDLIELASGNQISCQNFSQVNADPPVADENNADLVLTRGIRAFVNTVTMAAKTKKFIRSTRQIVSPTDF